jgi:hypothetical protein
LPVGNPNCEQGGSKFTAADGTIAFACNGAGGGGGGTIDGTGTIEVGACDDSVQIGFASKFTAGDFVLQKVTFNAFSTNCANRNIAIFFTMTANGTGFLIDDQVQCSYTLPAATGWAGAPGPNITIASADVACQNVTHPLLTITNGFNSLPTRYLDPTVGIEII